MEDLSTVDASLMKQEVLEGLTKPQKQLPSKYFYDERGSDLFEQITRLDEYYLTDCEKEILQSNISEISDRIGSDVMLIELGSGSSYKTRYLLEELLDLSTYIPVDISEEFLLKTVNQLRMEYPKISIIPVFADYTSSFALPVSGNQHQKQIVFFPGSTIGNFNPSESRAFLQNIAEITADDSEMLIGVDLKKDTDVLEAAYNDQQGITAQFNKNMLRHINHVLDADFEVEKFDHNAFYNEEAGRIEMHLVSSQKQTVNVSDQEIAFAEGESIHTENSYKYSLEEFEELVGDWYSVEKVWTDEKDYFSLQYLKKK
ncbi:L-histidine N(alpha)-methyltransferase [Fodinibius sp.]|uniref:L-histidine N(alpha)-methyltransferase n=1 Tax=Fodinibius sp. TaxID=1872440 RepID=UPI002ACD3CAC|nr:L-histidine N(alpha)-methyltransferase [Fodinibius sp.]MDZ7658693.1 L-histidine N(alpha)-methyltransferase [Fodinibius sp.]